jgi:hypothetical protein
VNPLRHRKSGTGNPPPTAGAPALDPTGEGDTPYLQGSTVPTLRRDYDKAPHQFCKHRLSAAIARRAQELIKATLADTNGHAEASSQPAQPDAPTTPLPEAPVSITLKATLHGHEVMVTLRGVDFASVKAQVEQASQWLSVQAPAQPPAQSTGQAERWERPGWCAKHSLQMTQNHKNGRSWWSHRLADGTWCKGR